MKDFKEIVKKNRSYRRFYQNERITQEQLKNWIDTARYTASGANRQPTMYKLSVDEALNQEIFKNLAWAGYYKDWDGPVDGERPAGYIFLITKKDVNAQYDEGIAAQTILLDAVANGYGGCMLANIKRDELMKVLNISDEYKIDLCLALGKPKEEVVIDVISGDGDIKYYRDENQVQHVPKKSLEDIIL